MTRFIALACLAVACGSSHSSAPSAPAQVEELPEDAAVSRPEAATLTIATYNVNFGLAGDPDIIELIREIDADVLFLQETNRRWERALRSELSELYPHMAFHHHRRAGGLGLLSKHAFDPGKRLAATSGMFPAWRVEIDTPLGKLQALQVHLQPPMLAGGSWFKGYFAAQVVHLEEIEGFYAQLDRSLPTIIIGDFNEDSTGKAVRWLGERGLVSAAAEHAPYAATWRWNTRRGEVRWQLDHILHGPELRSENAQVLEGGSSDHFPVIAEFAITP